MTLLLPTVSWAEDLQGNDTPGNWRVTHHTIHDIWNSMCDEREEQGALVQRCYLRRVDVFSPRPKFAAQFLFITPEAQGYKVEFGMEPGTLFSPNGFRIETMQGDIWRTRFPGCLTGLSCTFSGASADSLIASMKDGDAFRFIFRDRHGRPQDLSWPLAGFDAAWDDFQEQSKARDLLPIEDQ